MMQTSAPGSSRWRHAAARRMRGFTLLEMLVVMVIIGIVTAVVALTPSRNPVTDLKDEAQRLATLLESAADEAQVRALPIAWQPVDGGYVFSEQSEDGGWHVLGDSLLKPYRWRTDVTGVAIRYSGSSKTLVRLVFGDESISAPVTIVLSAGGRQLDVVSTGIGNFEVRQP